MKAGEMNRRITIQAKTVTYNTYNEPIASWTDIETIWAQVLTSGGGEFYAAQKLHAETSAVFKVRYTSRINVNQRIKFGNRYFDILNIADPDGKRIDLLIAGKEVV